ncbi:MAG TPA: hypothetical protein VGN04_05600, partial [Herbaspirillum sp.]
MTWWTDSTPFKRADNRFLAKTYPESIFAAQQTRPGMTRHSSGAIGAHAGVLGEVKSRGSAA